MSRFTERHLDPASRLGEILFGLIMVLTVTLTASFTVADGKKGVHQLLLAQFHAVEARSSARDRLRRERVDGRLGGRKPLHDSG